jgi:haloalkane dehalogenase
VADSGLDQQMAVQHMAAARREHLVPGREIHLQDMRGYPFSEVGLITGDSTGNAIANVWNTTGACEPTPERLGSLDAGLIARENGATRAWIHPVRQWTFDRLDVREAGDDRAFGDITCTWMGAADAPTMLQATVEGSYDPGYVCRSESYTFAEGRPVFVLDAPDGEAFVLQSFTRHWDPGLTRDNLVHLGSRLDLPDGWGFRVEVLERDMEVSTTAHDNLAHMMQDNLHNVYQGSDVGRAFSDVCRQDSLW